MNKTVIRTSLIWILIIAIGGAVAVYRQHKRQQPAATNAPLATGTATQAAAATAPQSMETPLAPVQLTGEQMQSIGVKTGTVERRLLNDAVRATGTVDINERGISYVQIRFPGYIRKVFANATYEYVRKGEPMFTLYSPELAETEREFLLARQNEKAMSESSVDGVASGAGLLVDAAEQRLRQWNVPENEIARLKQNGTVSEEITVNSPASGYITERNALPNMAVDTSTRLYTIADLANVWVNAQVFQNDLGRVALGETAAVTVDAYPDKTFTGRMEEILPQVDMATRTVRVRLVVNNPGVKLKPGMFVNVELKSAMGRQLVVPTTAVFQTGTSQVVFIDHGNGSLEPRNVVLGAAVGDQTVVLKGLKAGEQIVTSANFLLDSESQLQAESGAQPAAMAAAAQTPTAPAAAIKMELSTNPNPPHSGANTFSVKLSHADGTPVTGAEVTVNLHMPAMPAMDMAAVNTTVKLAAKSGGVYEGAGTLDSGGTWQVTINAKQNGQMVATKQLRINAEGGM
jgi:Cu(I)/Ag(I) efflux system membrane fusion protein/cobalt-zinc-cadmium efflux system membrane fusion protein